MATSTLLEIVQDMLTAIEAENVTTVVSGSTTEEALMCVNVANRTFESLITRAKWKHLKTYKPLIAGSNLNELKPDTSDLYVDGLNIYYGAIDAEQIVHYIDPDEFVRRTIGRTSADSDVTVVNNIKVYNDRVPTFYTTFDDETLVFDSMPSGAGLVASDSTALIYVEPVTRKSVDADVYDLPKQLYPHFRDLCVAEGIVEIGGDEIRGERMRARANKEIAKQATSGAMIEKKDNGYKNIISRNASGRKRTRIIVI